jgi:aminoglycoside phosphotransferase (APT) family kinase protein
MKLAPSSRYLSLLLDTFETHIMPDLQSPSAHGNAGYFLTTLKELLRRELHYPVVLPSINAEGAMTAMELRRILGINAPPQAGAKADTQGKPSDLIETFNVLSNEIACLAERLSALGDKTPPSSQTLLRRAAEWECEAHNQLLSDANLLKNGDDVQNAQPMSREVFQSYIQIVHPDGDKAQVTAYERVLGGFGNQTWAVTVQDAASSNQQLIVRKKERVLLIQHKDYALEREFHLVRTLNAMGFPAPKPLWMAKDAAGADAPFYVMERLPGKPPGSFFGGADKLPEVLVLEWAELLAKLHAFPLESFDGFIQKFDSAKILTETMEQNFRRNIAGWRTYIKEIPHLPSSTLVYLLDWLERNIPADSSKPVLTHGDFGIHNMLVHEGHVSAVLDWEATAFGSPALDLGYVKPVVEQHMDWKRFVKHYEKCSGRSIDPATLIYCNALQTMRLLVPMNRATKLTQDADLSEIRHTTFELGFNPHFMKVALAGTSGGNKNS